MLTTKMRVLHFAGTHDEIRRDCISEPLGCAEVDAQYDVHYWTDLCMTHNVIARRTFYEAVVVLWFDITFVGSLFVLVAEHRKVRLYGTFFKPGCLMPASARRVLGHGGISHACICLVGSWGRRVA